MSNTSFDLSALPTAEFSSDQNFVNHVFVFRKDGKLFAHYAHEKRYTVGNMEGWYGYDIEVLAYAHRDTKIDPWQWQQDTVDHEAVEIFSQAVKSSIPQPKAELIVQLASSTGIIWLWTSSNDAALWVEQNAAQFGTLHEPSEYSKHWDLFVSPQFNFQEVADYLNSYNAVAE